MFTRLRSSPDQTLFEQNALEYFKDLLSAISLHHLCGTATGVSSQAREALMR